MSRATVLKNDANDARHPLGREGATGWLPPTYTHSRDLGRQTGKYWSEQSYKNLLSCSDNQVDWRTRPSRSQ